MSLKLRSGAPEDAETCGNICCEGFKTIEKLIPGGIKKRWKQF